MREAYPRASPKLGSSSIAGPSFPWSELLEAPDVSEALGIVGRWLGPGTASLTLVRSGDGAPLGHWPGEAATASPVRREVEVAGDPPWRLSLTGEGPLSARRLEHGAMALEAWRHAGGLAPEADHRLRRRAEELERLAALSARAAEAGSTAELLGAVAGFLTGELDADAVLAGSSDEPAVLVQIAAPLRREVVTEAVTRVQRYLGRAPDPNAIALRGPLSADGEVARMTFRDEDLLLVPLLGRAAGCLALLLSAPAGERDLRLAYGAANQLALHLDRLSATRRAEAERFRVVVESLSIGVFVVDDEGSVLVANARARERLPAIRDGGQGSRESIERSGLGALLRDAAGDGPRTVERASPDGESLWSWTVTRLADPAARPAAWVVTLDDVTEARRLQERVAHAEKMSSLGQMISGVAHELNNPLASILGYTQLLRGGSSDEATRRRLEVLAREGERCRRIVAGLLSFARRQKPERQALSVNEIVRSVLHLLGYALRVDGVRVETDLADDLPAISADAHQLEQILVNLLANARQAIASQQSGGTIRIRTVAVEGGVELELRDSGPGIPSALRSKIFDPFFTTKAAGEGTGLGLSIVYGIVTEHGGRIALLEDGPGAAFRIFLPVGAPVRAAAMPADLPPHHASPGRILVVDDEESVAQLIRDVLVSDGHEVELAGDGSSALDRCATARFDLVISDLRMPGLDGRGLHAALDRRDPALGRRMLLTTGDTLNPEIETFLADAALEVVRKPFDVEELRRRVRQRLASPPAG